MTNNCMPLKHTVKGQNILKCMNLPKKPSGYTQKQESVKLNHDYQTKELK